MKITVAQVMHLDKAVTLLGEDLDRRYKATAAEAEAQRAAFRPLFQAVESLQRHVSSLMGAEFTIKG